MGKAIRIPVVNWLSLVRIWGCRSGKATVPKENAKGPISWPPAPKNVVIPNVTLAFSSQINSVLFISQGNWKHGLENFCVYFSVL